MKQDYLCNTQKNHSDENQILSMTKSITKVHLLYILVKHPAPGDSTHR